MKITVPGRKFSFFPGTIESLENDLKLSAFKRRCKFLIISYIYYSIKLLDYKLKISNGRHLKIFNDTDFKEDKRHLMREKHKLMKFIENNYDTIKNFILIKNKTKITNNF